MTIQNKTTYILLLAQIVFCVLFGIFVDYGKQAGPVSHGNNTNHSSSEESILDLFYPMYQDVHVMMLVGFGFLLTFLKRHGYSSLGFTFLILCYVIQWSLLVNGWFSLLTSDESRIMINIESLLFADFAAATVLISYCAILSVSSPIQLIIMATFEVVFFNISLFLGEKVFGALDVGGSIFVHAFGAYFGLAVARILYQKSQTLSTKESSTYESNISAMIGTTFLWLFWPSFNSAAASGNERHRVVINTVLSLCAGTLVTVAISSIIGNKKKLNMVHIQNATLAGGAVIAGSADMIVRPYGALLIGAVAAVLTSLGFEYLQPFLQRKIKLHDTCGIHNLHEITGIVGAITSAIVIALATKEVYLDSYEDIFMREPSAYRISMNQSAAQIVSLLVTVAIAITTGAITGCILKFPLWDNLTSDELYDDGAFWETEQNEAEKQQYNVQELKAKDLPAA